MIFKNQVWGYYHKGPSLAHSRTHTHALARGFATTRNSGAGMNPAVVGETFAAWLADPTALILFTNYESKEAKWMCNLALGLPPGTPPNAWLNYPLRAQFLHSGTVAGPVPHPLTTMAGPRGLQDVSRIC